METSSDDGSGSETDQSDVSNPEVQRSLDTNRDVNFGVETTLSDLTSKLLEQVTCLGGQER